MTHPLHGPHRFKLGVFSANADGGLAITTVPERWRASWADNVAAARIAEEAGLDFFLPIARWKGFGGETRVREHSFETFTWAAGLAAVTSRIGLFMTVHVPLVHPVYAAKALATVDHISGGRAGLNIVCGWNPEEFAMFGAAPEERAYDRAAEWITIIERAYAAEEPFDFEGRYYRLKGVVSRPASIQRPRPVTMNAAFGPPGRDFAARHCDFLFSTFSEIADGHRHVEDMRARSAAVGREVGVYTVCHVVCRETQAEAEAYYRRYAVEMADHAAVEAHMAGKKAFAASHDAAAFDLYRQRFAGGAGSYPLIGTPERIAEEIAAIAAQGYAGAALSFVNYTAELPFFCARVLPLLRQAGLREG
ncbi:MAG: LLM class flavin-dependent oxidoreductase [Acetobacteraceae bacterium]|nr:LLM class flavin-dependent oxidoreductase [Acetobacteraceae bacterium]MCX7684855.1 LLM class flavin-dependent oxidoreductase [Acetobacteraceae bacterium]MDW8397549.1 LLM class flavin-dependent oxidoreductase [Acetobacteraceae bacterium]